MNSLYLILNIGTISVPLAASFHPRIRKNIRWINLILSILITATVFLIWDYFFTANKVWGFNEEYLIGYSILGMPIEEWLFFFCIPYASLMLYFISPIKIKEKFTRTITLFFAAVSFLVAILFYSKAYTFINYMLLSFILLYSYFFKIETLRKFYVAFLIVLVPFFVVNGILTGSFIENEVVWYNNDENLGIRIGTIPIEDIGYAFSMLFLTLILYKPNGREGNISGQK